MDCPIKSPQRDADYGHLGFSLVRPMPEFWPTQFFDDTIVLFYATTSVVICYVNNRKTNIMPVPKTTQALTTAGRIWVEVWECMWTLNRLNKPINLKFTRKVILSSQYKWLGPPVSQAMEDHLPIKHWSVLLSMAEGLKVPTMEKKASNIQNSSIFSY